MLGSRVVKSAPIKLALVVAGSALFAACAGAPPKETRTAKPMPVERASEKKPYDFRSEGTIPPLKPDDAANEPDVEERGVSETPIDVSDAEAPPVTAPPPSPAPVVPVAAASEALIDGFRVQVFAGADREIAENAARVAQERLGQPTYVELDGGMYKVRAGDFTTRELANQALPAIRAAYPDAWIVGSKVRAPQGQ